MQDEETGRDGDGRPAGGSSEAAPMAETAPTDEGAPADEAEPEPPDEVSFGPQAEAEAKAGPPRRRRGRVAVYAVVVLAAIGLGTAAAVGLNSRPSNPPTGVSSHQVPGPQNDVSGGSSLRTSAVAAKVDPGVVDIDALIAYSGGTSSEGTGMVISRDGLILTNNHVINGSNSIRIRPAVAHGGKQYTVTVVGYDATHDVALLKINNP